MGEHDKGYPPRTGQESAQPATPPSQQLPSNPRPISIWQPSEVDGQAIFVRPEPLPLGDHYADRAIIAARKPATTKRICLFGESVAAGYLYAPHLTPAKALSALLNQSAAGDQYDVIDLARTNETLTSLAETAEASLQLDPDVLVIFAGNNWTVLETPDISPYAGSARMRQEFAISLENSGPMGPAELAAERILRHAAQTLSDIANVARSNKVEVILVIPEVNLADWSSRQPATWLSAGNTARWHELYQTATAQIGARRWEDARATAFAMFELDGYACPTTFGIVAAAQAGLGDTHGAATACRAVVDADSYATACQLPCPRANRMAREILSQSAAQHGFSIVDLPQVFAEFSGSALPGRQLFLDYCHLTAEGIGVAMGAVAGVLNGHTGSSNRPIAVTAEQQAVAYFGAAIHTAHRLSDAISKRDLIDYWCQKALETSPGITSAMVDYVDVRTASSPTELSAAQQRNLTSPYPLQLQHGWKYDYLDIDVIQAIEKVSESRDPETAAAIQRLLVSRLSIGSEPIDLIQPRSYLWEPLDQFFADLLRPDERAYYRSPWPRTDFCLIVENPCDLELVLCVRIPSNNRPSASEIRLEINRDPIATVALTEGWNRVTIGLDAASVAAGVNRLSIRWPLPTCLGDIQLELAINQLKQGRQVDIHPVFGEIYSLIAKRP